MQCFGVPCFTNGVLGAKEKNLLLPPLQQQQQPLWHRRCAKHNMHRYSNSKNSQIPYTQPRCLSVGALGEKRHLTPILQVICSPPSHRRSVGGSLAGRRSWGRRTRTLRVLSRNGLVFWSLKAYPKRGPKRLKKKRNGTLQRPKNEQVASYNIDLYW